MNDSKERRKKKGEGEGERLEDKTPTTTAGAAPSLSQTPLLKALENMLHDKIKQRKEQVHKTKNIAENDKLSIEIDTLH